MNPIHTEPCRAIPKTAIPEPVPLAELVRHNTAFRREQTDHRDTDDQAICLERIVLNSDLDFF